MTLRDLSEQLTAILLVGLGGFAGSNLRYFVEVVVPSTLVATAAVNILGCITIGFGLYLKIAPNKFSQGTRAVLVTGFISPFTIYSPFLLNVLTTRPALTLGYIVGSYVIGFRGVLVGRHLAEITANSPILWGERESWSHFIWLGPAERLAPFVVLPWVICWSTTDFQWQRSW